MIQKVFDIGNSVALTIPKETGIEAGTKVKFTQKNNTLIYEILSPKSPTPQEDHIRKTSAGFKIKIPNLKQVLKDLKEDQYDKKIRIS